jgi:hypothetical protein
MTYINKNKVVLVSGMHRSGTSALMAGVHQVLGVNVENTKEKAAEDNLKGFFEDTKVTGLNDQILVSIGASWDSLSTPEILDFSDAHFNLYRQEALNIVEEYTKDNYIWGIKDPRLSILMPFWENVIREFTSDIFRIIALRHPLEVALSQKKRHEKFPEYHFCGEDLRYTINLWFLYNIRLLKNLSDDRNLITSFDRLLDNPANEIRRIGSLVGVEANSEGLDEYSNSFLEKQMKHHNVDQSEMQPYLAEYGHVFELYNRMKQFECKDILSKDDAQELLDGMPDDHVLQSWTAPVFGYAHTIKEKLSQTYQDIVTKDSVIADKDRILSESASVIAEKDQLLADSKMVIAEKEQKIVSQQEAISQKEADMAKKDQLLADAEAVIAKKELTITAKEEAISQNEADMAKKDRLLADAEAAIAKKELTITAKEEAISQNEAVMAKKGQLLADAEVAIAKKEQTIASQEEAISQKEAVMAKKDRLLADAEVTIAKKELTITAKEEAISQNKAVIAEKDQALAESASVIVEKDQTIAAKDIMISEKDQALAQANADLNELKGESSDKDQQIHGYREELYSVYTSKSWRYTLLMRKAGTLVRRIVSVPHKPYLRTKLKRAYFLLPAFIRNSRLIDSLKNRFKQKETSGS